MYLVEYVIYVRIKLLFEANDSNRATFVTVAFVYYSFGVREFLVFKLKLTSSHGSLETFDQRGTPEMCYVQHNDSSIKVYFELIKIS